MTGDELEPFLAELQRLKPARPPEGFVERLGAAVPKRRAHTRQTATRVAQIFNLLYRRFSTCWPQPLTRRAADYKSAIQNLRWRVLRWVAPGAVAVAIGIALWFRHAAVPERAAPPRGLARVNPALKADHVEIDRQFLASFDAVARLPGGEPVRFRCREWVDQVVLRDSKRGVVIEQRKPHLEVVPVGFETD